MVVLTDFPERFLETERVHLHQQQPPVYELGVESARLHGGGVLLKLEAVDSIELAELFRGYFLGITEDELAPLEEDEYWHFELEGLEARGVDGKKLGVLREVLSTPGHDLYAIDTEDGQELLIPAVKEYVPDICLEEGFLTVVVPEIE